MKARIPQGMGGPANMQNMMRQAQKMQDDMKAINMEEVSVTETSSVTENFSVKAHVEETKIQPKPTPQVAIQWGNNILNDSLYLGVKNGAVHQFLASAQGKSFL